jgi:hypothetical protein
MSTRPPERHPDSRIVRSALDEVKAIQTLLEDAYKDAGDGRTLLRELVQNADDAVAEQLMFVVLEYGWPHARNSLLRGPALLVANDGPFSANDRDALHRALGGSKADDTEKVGRFGVGLKSVFHICEAIVYLGADQGVPRLGVLNPWAGTGNKGVADPIHEDWDMVADEDYDRLARVARLLLGRFEDGLLLWVPLRRGEHLDRAQHGQYGLGQVCPVPEEVATWFGRPASLALLLAQCGHLHSIEADRAVDPERLAERTRLARVLRPEFGRGKWVGRYGDDPTTPDRPFGGRIEDKDYAWSVVGIEALGLDSLRELRSAPDWPKDPHWQNGISDWVPRKALAHAAVTVLRSEGALLGPSEARLRWAVFLPLDDDPNPRSSAIVETVGYTSGSEVWDIILHGYFWPSHDRRSIPGVTNDDVGAGDNAVRTRWNRAVRDELLLPLLPRVLENAVIEIREGTARQLLEAVVNSQTIKAHLPAVTRRHVLLPLVTEGGVRWTAYDTAGANILSIPTWTRAPSDVRRVFTECLSERTDNIIFIDADAPKLGGQVGLWSPDWIERLLGCIPTNVLRTSSDLAWIGGLVRHVLGSQSVGHIECPAAVAHWIAKRIGEGALSSTVGGALQEDLREAWRGIFRTLPAAWLVDAPVTSQQAVVELASQGFFGDGLLPIPFGLRQETACTSRPNQERLERSLLKLGKRLEEDVDGSQHTHHSRLLLAETFLSVREERTLGEELSKLPLLRATKLPEEKDEAWSVEQLNRQTELRRVFSRPTGDDGDNLIVQDSPSDPKRAVKDLAEALNENTWLVYDTVASISHAPIPTTAALSVAVLHMGSIQSAPEQRIRLVQRLAEDASNPIVRRAIRTLLTGRGSEVEEERRLYYVRSQDSDKDANRKTLGILLRLLGLSWCAIEPGLVEPLPLALVEDLHVKTVDAGVLHQLLDECLTERTDWSRLEQLEILHLLLSLHGTSPNDRARWRAMPLHRRAGGDRGCFDERALRAAGELRLPPGLESEILLLDPDREVADLYLDVPALDDDGILRAMLMSRRPYLFAEQIVLALRTGGDERVILPRDSRLIALLREAQWLPRRDDPSGLAPKFLLIVPRELRPEVVPLANGGAIGEYRFPEDVVPALWITAKSIIYEILGRPSRSLQLQRLARVLNPTKIAEVDDGAYLILPAAERVTHSLIEEALQSPLAGSHPGWALLRTAVNVIGPGGERQPHDAELDIARALCAAIPAKRQISILRVVAATRPPKDSPSGRLFRTLLESYTEIDGFFEDVLPHIELPTQDGQWQPVSLIARSASGVARRHRVISDLRLILRLDRDEIVSAEGADDIKIGAGSAEVLAKYFKPWADHLPHGAVGSFICLLGDGKDGLIVRLAGEWLGDDVNIEGMRGTLVSSSERDPCSTINIYVSGYVAQGNRVQAVNLLGKRVEMDAGSDNDTIFATDPVRSYSVLGDFWEIDLREVDPKRKTAHELVGLLGSTVEWWAVQVLRLDLQNVRSWWSRWGTGSQAQVGPVQASVLAHLPLTLHQLDVRECEPLRDALREAQRAQRRREQASPVQIREAMDTERAALDRLASLIRDNPDHQTFLWSRVQELIRRFGYRDDSVLLELAQNADDALSQAVEIAGSPLPLTARGLWVRVHILDGVTTIDVRHHGRPINDTGGAAFPAGREYQWDQDLYFMMLLNLSGKPGEVPGQATAASTTGRFGLGFKSVHLVSASPSVVSGFIAFSIAGGLLPIEQPVPDDQDLLPIKGHRATRVRLPLRKDAKELDLIASVFRRFMYTRTLLPVFSRQLREVVVDGGPFAGISVFDPQPIDGAAGWSVAAETVELPKQGHWRILRFRPADTGANAATGTASLAVGLKDGKPASFPIDLPFLWNVTPTSEDWGCGYAVNGPFKLDPGRTHVSLDDDATCRVVDLLGEALGKGLIDLHDSLLGMPIGTIRWLPEKSTVHSFLASLWKVLTSGIDSLDELRRGILLRLHGPGRGLSVWMTSRSVVPSDLPAPFAERLPPLKPGMQIRVARGGFEDPNLCRAFAEIGDVASLAVKQSVVSTKVAECLRPLLPIHLPPLDPSSLLAEVAELWDHALTPERLHALRPLACDSIWKSLSNDLTWHSKLVARAADGSSGQLRELLLPRDIGLSDVDADVEDELRRAAFAPDSRTIDAAYITRAEDLTMFLRLRIRHQIDARTIAAWYANLPQDRRPAALIYLLRGKLQHEVLQWLVPSEHRPDWLEDYDEVRQLLENLDKDHWRTHALLAALFPGRFKEVAGPNPVVPGTTKRLFFDGLEQWWDDPNVRRAVIDSYEGKAWPDWLRRDGLEKGLQTESHDHWLCLLVLGACHSLGRAEAGHHRSFLESAYQEGWWDVFKVPDDVAAWMNVLRTWQDRAVADLKYSRWMSLFPAIYQLSRYLEKYRRLLKSASLRPEELYRVTCLLAPRIDEALSGAGQHFDAPPAPLNMGLHWVLRELVRLRIIDGNHVFPDCWVPSDRVLRFLYPLGLNPLDGSATNSEKARAISDFLALELKMTPHLHRAFDIPLRHIDSSAELRRRFGLEE